MIHACAWCHYQTDESGNRTRFLPESEYKLVISHGICRDCKTEQLSVYLPNVKSR